MIITGGAGFIGGHLAKRLPEARIFDRKIPGSDYWTGNERTYIHLAASTYLTDGYDRQIIEDNFRLPIELLEIFDKDYDRLIYASSASVYNLNNLYAYSKKYAEDLFSDCNATGLRYYNVYGPNDNGVVSKLIRCALKGETFTLNGGHQTRDFVYIDDVVQATIDAIDSKEKIIEVGTGIGTSIYELIELVQTLTGKKVFFKQKIISSFETIKSVCPAPLKKFTPLEEGLIKTIEYESSIL